VNCTSDGIALDSTWIPDPATLTCNSEVMIGRGRLCQQNYKHNRLSILVSAHFPSLIPRLSHMRKSIASNEKLGGGLGTRLTVST